MSARPFHKRYHSDALAGFMSLDLEERGAYQTLLDLIYDRGGPIADNERLLAGYMGCSVRKWRTLRDQLIAKRKIRLTEAGDLTNSRAEKELENDAKTARKLAENGSKGGRTRAENAEKPSEIKGGDQAPLEPRSSLYQKPEARSQSSARAGAREADLVPTPFEQQCRDLAKVIGLTRPIAANDRDQLRRWLADGCDFRWHVLEAAQRVAAREQARNRSIGGFAYLDGAVREYRAEWQAERESLLSASAGAAH